MNQATDAYLPGALLRDASEPGREHSLEHSPPPLRMPLRLLLLLTQPSSSPEQQQQIHEVAARLRDWPEFLSLVQHHRVAPLVFASLLRLHPPGVPPSVLEALRGSAAANSFRVLRTGAETERLVAAMAKAGFPVRVLKGYTLSQEIFGSRTTRQCGDIDLLTEPVRLSEQLAVLDGLGYRLEHPGCRLTPRRLEAYAALHKDFTLCHRDGAFSLDLHWRLFHHRAHPGNRLVSAGHFREVPSYGAGLRVLDADDQFCYVAAHGMSDGWLFFKALADMAGFLHRFGPAELDAALQRARELGLLGQVAAAVHLTAAWMEIPVTSPLLAGRDRALCQRLQAQLERTLAAYHGRPTRDALTVRQWMRQEHGLLPPLRSLPDLGRRFIHRPHVWATVNLPDTLFWLYPLLACVVPPARPAQATEHPLKG